MAYILPPAAKEITSRTGKTITIWGVRSLENNNFFCFQYGCKRAYVAQGEFVTTKLEARKILQMQDIIITDDKFWRGILQEIEEIHSFVNVPLIERPGWTGVYFADAFGKTYTPKGHPQATSTMPRSRKPAQGTFKRWTAQVALPLTGQRLPMVAVLAALASPLLAIVGEAQNIGLEFWGPPAKGKTTLLRIMASTAGDPARIANFNSTLAGLERLFPQHRDLPLLVDEANLNNQGDQFLKDFSFRMANGTTRLTAFDTANERYRFIFATTSNRPFHEGLRNIDTLTADAALQRLMPICVPDTPLGVFDHLPAGFTTSGALASHIADAIGASYGRVMPRFLRALVNAQAAGSNELKITILKDVRAFEQIVGVAASEQGKTRASSAFGLFYAAGQFAVATGILPKTWDCLAACLTGYRNYQSQLPEQTPPVARLLAIAQRRETRDLRTGGLPSLTDEQIAAHGAFIHLGVGGRIELLFTDSVRREFFPDWRAAKSILIRSSILHCKRGREQVHRRVRREGKPMRFFCAILPPTVAGLIAGSAGRAA